MLNEAAACSRRPTRPDSLKYFPAQIPSSSGDRMSSDTADSSNMLDEIFYGKSTKSTKIQFYLLFFFVQKKNHNSLNSLEMWHNRLAGSDNLLACWGILPPKLHCGPDSGLPQRGSLSLSVSLPCSEAMSGAGQESSGSLWQSLIRNQENMLSFICHTPDTCGW